MTCKWTDLPDGTRIVMCGWRPERQPRCAECRGQKATKLCDFPVAAGVTCDRNLCDRCAVQIGRVDARLSPGNELVRVLARNPKMRGDFVPWLCEEDTVDYCPAHANAVSPPPTPPSSPP